jgi:uncharacterized protein YbjT (DUF2867 family)
MKILVVGATGGLGRDVVAEALAGGHDTTALVRNPSSGVLPRAVELAEGDVLDPASLAPAVRGQEAVVCALGTPSPRQQSTLLREGTRNLVSAMSRENVQRLVCVTLLGTGASQANGSLFYGQVILRLLSPMLPDKEAQEEAVRQSELDWVIVRPPRFVKRRPNGRLTVIREGQPGRLGHVIRADLAHWLVERVADRAYAREAVAVGS